MAHSTLVSLAVLKVNWDHEQKSYLDLFVPFVAEAIRTLSPEVVQTADLQAAVEQRFGLAIPEFALKSILERVRKAGYVVRRHRTYRPAHEALEKLGFEDRRTQLDERYTGIVSAVCDYAEQEHGLVWSEGDASSALLNYLRGHDLSLTVAARSGSTIPTVGKSPRNSDFVLSSFAADQQSSQPEQFALLETVVQGNMLANALFLPNPQDVQRKFRNTAVYLDSPLLLRALGYSGPALAGPPKELLDLLGKAGARVCCFEASVQEVRGMLEACASLMTQPKAVVRFPLRDTYNFFKDEGRSPSDVLLRAAEIEQALRGLNIHIMPRPQYRTQYNITTSTKRSWRSSCRSG